MKKPVKTLVASLGMVAALGAFSSSANAAITWTLSPDANAVAFGVTVLDGVAQINSPDTTQPMGIYGAGFTMTSSSAATFSMKFDSDLYTWDSYNALGTNSGGNGYWDAFVVTVNTTGYYWDLPQSDPVATGPSTWAWGGTNYTDGILESYITAPGATDMITLSSYAPATFFVSLVLDTKTPSFADTNHPSWGSFHVAPKISPIPEPETYAMMLAGLGLLGFSARRRKDNA